MPTKELQFPARGVVRRHSLRSTTETRGPFGSPWSVNVRLEDVLTERLRGGSFTGIAVAARPESIVYRGRTLTFDGRAVTASRVGDAADTTLSSDVSDMLRPALFQFSFAENQGADVVALVPHKDRFLLGFSASETWVQAGDPLSGPRRRVSDEVGIVGPDAWCVNHDTIYFLSSDGLYSVGADGSDLTPLSEELLPVELSGITDEACTLTYNHGDRGVYIHTSGVDWYYDTVRGGFWSFNTGTSQSHVLIGPFRIGGPDGAVGPRHGRILNIQGELAIGSDDVTWALVTGASSETAAINGKLAIEASVAGNSYEAYVAASGVWQAGKNRIAYPRTRAMSAVLWLRSTGDWSFETASVTVAASGHWKGSY